MSLMLRRRQNSPIATITRTNVSVACSRPRRESPPSRREHSHTFGPIGTSREANRSRSGPPGSSWWRDQVGLMRQESEHLTHVAKHEEVDRLFGVVGVDVELVGAPQLAPSLLVDEEAGGAGDAFLRAGANSAPGWQA